MTPHEMLCHLGDAFESTMGDRSVSRADTWLSRTLIRFVALHTPLPWPRGVPTRPEVDPKRGGTRPVAFERDRDKVRDLLRRFAAPGTQHAAAHPIFGPLSPAEWLRWGYRHTDHHLRQFGQ